MIDVTSCANDAEAILASGHIDYTVVKMPINIVGKNEQRLFPGKKALVHSKTGKPFDICSDKYNVHDPREIIKSAVSEFGASGITVNRVASWHGGENVIIEADINPQGVEDMRAAGGNGDYASRSEARAAAGYKRGDVLGATISIKIGNTVGNPAKIVCRMIELACLNSATVESKQISIVTHRKGSEAIVLKLAELLPQFALATRKYVRQREALISQRVSDQTMRTYLLELSQPELFQQVLEKTVANLGAYTPDVQRSMFIESVNSHDTVDWLLKNKTETEGNKFLRKAVDNLYAQPLADGVRGTLYQPYMAATYVTDHLGYGRGEYAQDNVADNNLFGSGAAFKTKALDLILQYQSQN